MLRRTAKYSWAVALLCIVILVTGGGGCKRSTGASTMSGSGISMSAPAGWRVEKQNPAMCSKGNCTGVILEESLDGKDFSEHVKTLALANSGSIVSEKPRTAGGCEAIEAVIEYPNAGSKSLKLYIHKGDRLIEASFVTPAEQFTDHESAIRAAFESIVIE